MLHIRYNLKTTEGWAHSRDPGWGPRLCISSKFPGSAAVAESRVWERPPRGEREEGSQSPTQTRAPDPTKGRCSQTLPPCLTDPPAGGWATFQRTTFPWDNVKRGQQRPSIFHLNIPSQKRRLPSKPSLSYSVILKWTHCSQEMEAEASSSLSWPQPQQWEFSSSAAREGQQNPQTPGNSAAPAVTTPPSKPSSPAPGGSSLTLELRKQTLRSLHLITVRAYFSCNNLLSGRVEDPEIKQLPPTPRSVRLRVHCARSAPCAEGCNVTAAFQIPSIFPSFHITTVPFQIPCKSKNLLNAWPLK